MNLPNHNTDSPIWRPWTQMKTSPPALKVVKGDGVWLELEDGRRILDCISSWWVTIHGHGHPALAEALYHQAQQLEQVIFANFTHDPAEQLARRLLTHVPNSLTRVFFTDNGSTKETRIGRDFSSLRTAITGTRSEQCHSESVAHGGSRFARC